MIISWSEAGRKRERDQGICEDLRGSKRIQEDSRGFYNHLLDREREREREREILGFRRMCEDSGGFSGIQEDSTSISWTERRGERERDPWI